MKCSKCFTEVPAHSDGHRDEMCLYNLQARVKELESENAALKKLAYAVGGMKHQLDSEEHHQFAVLDALTEAQNKLGW